MSSFSKAFAKARKEQGPGGTFTWRGKQYTTDRADDKPSKSTKTSRPKARPESTTPTTSPRPRSKPRSTTPTTSPRPRSKPDTPDRDKSTPSFRSQPKPKAAEDKSTPSRRTRTDSKKTTTPAAAKNAPKGRTRKAEKETMSMLQKARQSDDFLRSLIESIRSR